MFRFRADSVHFFLSFFLRGNETDRKQENGEGEEKNRIVRFVGPAALTPQAQPVIHQGFTNPSNVKYPSSPPPRDNRCLVALNPPTLAEILFYICIMYLYTSYTHNVALTHTDTNTYAGTRIDWDELACARDEYNTLPSVLAPRLPANAFSMIREQIFKFSVRCPE